ncbi:xylulokinase [Pseudonocardia xinjiangensis]|uniref:xylulokinase n=1 Tax=Pseudonocardia xinjiangensis TaxID=75289 RepID=UPI003D8A2C1F
MATCFIGIDLGTSACKVLALDTSGEVLDSSVREYPVLTSRPGWAEQEPARWWEATDDAVRELLDRLPADSQVRGFGLCGQMHGLTALDENREVIRPAILWNDQRAAPQCTEITERAGGLPGLIDLVQNRMLPGFTAGKILWLREHEPAAYERMRHLVNPKDYLRLRMTGDLVTEVSDASGTGLFDVRGRRWSTELLDLLDIPVDLLPRVVESHEPTGTLRPEVAQRWGLPASTPVFGGGGDAVIQTTSMGIIEDGAIGITLGTAGIVAGASGACPDDIDGTLQISCGNAPDRWHVMGVSLVAGGAFQWLRDALRPVDPELGYRSLVDLARQAPPGSEGLLFLPYLLGERCPHVAPEARGSWVGLTPMHSTAHLSRSVMEGVLLNLREIVEVCESTGLDCTQVRVSGGATVEPLWLQMLADVLQREVVTVTGAAEGGAYGAALLAGVGTGDFASLADAAALVQETSRFKPEADNAELYDRLFAIHRRLYRTLQPTFAELAGAQR